MHSLRHCPNYPSPPFGQFMQLENLTGLAGGVKEGQNMGRMGLAFIYFLPRSLLEAPKCVKDPGNTPKMIPPTAPD